MVTEFGYHDAMNAATGMPPTPDTVAANYLLRTYLVDYLAGIPRSYAYELVDEKANPSLTDQEQHFGLLTSTIAPKPQYLALKNLLASLGHGQDPGCNSTAACSSGLQPLPLGLTGTTRTLRHTVFEKDQTHYVLVLWQDRPVWDSATRAPISVPTVDVEVTVPELQNATVTEPTVSGQASEVSAVGGTMRIAVPADPLVVALTLNPSCSSCATTDPSATKPPAANKEPTKAPSSQPVALPVAPAVRARIAKQLTRQLHKARVAPVSGSAWRVVASFSVPRAGVLVLTCGVTRPARRSWPERRRPLRVSGSVRRRVGAGKRVTLRVACRLPRVAQRGAFRLVLSAAFRPVGGDAALTAARTVAAPAWRR